MLKPVLGSQLRLGHPLAQGLVACWLMNEGCGGKVYDLSGNGNTGVLTDMAFPPTTDSGWSPGKFGRTLHFDGGNDYIDCGNGASLNIVDEITVEIYITPDLFPQLDFTGLIGKSSSHSLLFWIPGPQIAVYAYFGGATKTLITTDSGITAGNQYQIIWSYISGAWKIYVNSVQKASSNQTGNIDFDVSKSVVIGRDRNQLVGRRFNGFVDLARIYNRALTAGEVQWLHSKPFAMFDQRRFWAVAAGHVPHFLLIRRAQ